jgi:hypothetical protein
VSSHLPQRSQQVLLLLLLLLQVLLLLLLLQVVVLPVLNLHLVEGQLPLNTLRTEHIIHTVCHRLGQRVAHMNIRMSAIAGSAFLMCFPSLESIRALSAGSGGAPTKCQKLMANALLSRQVSFQVMVCCLVCCLCVKGDLCAEGQELQARILAVHGKRFLVLLQGSVQ